MKTIFLDTNVVLDLLDQRRNRHEQARQLIAKLVGEDVRIVISEDMLSTIYYIIRDKPAVLEFFQWIVDRWQVVPFGRKIIEQAIQRCQHSPKLDFEDTLQCFCAKENGCDLLITNDADFIECGIPLVSVEDFLD